jgi:hypothetical protein
LVGHFLPPQIDTGVAAALIILDPQVVHAAAQAVIPSHFTSGAIIPGINNQAVVNPETHPIIHKDVEAIGPSVEMLAASPASREVVCRYIGSW